MLSRSTNPSYYDYLLQGLELFHYGKARTKGWPGRGLAELDQTHRLATRRQGKQGHANIAFITVRPPLVPPIQHNDPQLLVMIQSTIFLRESKLQSTPLPASQIKYTLPKLPRGTIAAASAIYI